MKTTDGQRWMLAGVSVSSLMVTCLVCGLWTARTHADECDTCATCSADPAFVQRDMRDPRMIQLLRRLGSTPLKKEGIKAILVLSEGQDASDKGPANEDAGTTTIMLVGKEGHKQMLNLLKQDMAAFADLLPPSRPARSADVGGTR